MNKREKEVQQTFIDNEKAVLKKLEGNYQDALDEINTKIELLMARQDADMQHVIYQVEYQKALKTQVQSILETLQANEFETVSDYLTKSYEDGFVGTMYNLQGQGIPLVFPIDQKQVVDAIQHETKLSSSLYTEMGHDIKDLQKKIAGEISRGLSSGQMYSEITRNIASWARIPKNRAATIARTEAHRIQNKASMDACQKAKDKGADVVKQWDASLDGKTRDSHRELNGQIRELDEPFEVNGMTAMQPGDFNDPAEDCNCRCALLQRARWALENDYTKWSPDAPVVIDDDGTTQFTIIEAKDYDSFKEQYNQASEHVREGAQKMNDGTKPTYYGGIPKDWKMIDASNDDAAKNANPNHGIEGYNINCPNCACAYELRKRGYDVIARPYIKGGSHYLNKEPWKAWEGIEPDNIKTNNELLDFVHEHENGSRFGIAIEYMDGTGHVIVGEIIEDKLKLYDPQTGKTFEDIDFDDVLGVKLWQTNEADLSDRGRTSCEGR